MEKSKIKRLYKLLEVSQVLFGTLKHSWVVSGSQRYISSLVPLRSGSSLGASNSFKVIIRTTSRRSGANSSSPCLSGRRRCVPRWRGRDAVLDREPTEGWPQSSCSENVVLFCWLVDLFFTLCVCDRSLPQRNDLIQHPSPANSSSARRGASWASSCLCWLAWGCAGLMCTALSSRR